MEDRAHHKISLSLPSRFISAGEELQGCVSIKLSDPEWENIQAQKEEEAYARLFSRESEEDIEKELMKPFQTEPWLNEGQAGQIHSEGQSAEVRADRTEVQQAFEEEKAVEGPFGCYSCPGKEIEIRPSLDRLKSWGVAREFEAIQLENKNGRETIQRAREKALELSGKQIEWLALRVHGHAQFKDKPQDIHQIGELPPSHTEEIDIDGVVEVDRRDNVTPIEEPPPSDFVAQVPDFSRLGGERGLCILYSKCRFVVSHFRGRLGREIRVLFSFPLPSTLPPTFRGETVRFYYAASLSAKQFGSTAPPSTVHLSFNVYSASFSFRLLQGWIGTQLDRDPHEGEVLINSSSLGEDTRPSEQISGKDTEAGDGGAQDGQDELSPLERDRKVAYLRRQWKKREKHIPFGVDELQDRVYQRGERVFDLDLYGRKEEEATSILQRQSYAVREGDRLVARVQIHRRSFHPGDSFLVDFDFSQADVHCLQISIGLVRVERGRRGAHHTHPPVFARSEDYEQTLCRHYRRKNVVMNVPVHACPSFVTDVVEVQWELRFEFRIRPFCGRQAALRRRRRDWEQFVKDWTRHREQYEESWKRGESADEMSQGGEDRSLADRGGESDAQSLSEGVQSLLSKMAEPAETGAVDSEIGREDGQGRLEEHFSEEELPFDEIREEALGTKNCQILPWSVPIHVDPVRICKDPPWPTSLVHRALSDTQTSKDIIFDV